MHTGPRGPLLFGWCTHYVPTTSHQPPATFPTAPPPLCTLQARLHCHIWTCPSIHVSLCLEDFSPQTSPSGTNYPMVGVLSMCPPHQFSQIPTSGHLCRPGPAFLPTWPFTACAPPCAPLCTPLHTSAHLCTPLHTFAHPSAHLRASLHTSTHLRAPQPPPVQLFALHFPGLVTLIRPSI